MTDFDLKLDAFVKLVEAEQNARAAVVLTILQEQAIKNGKRGYYEVYSKPGRKFVQIMVGSTCSYFVDKSDGTIFGSKSCKAVNFNRSFGTLDTIHEWDWSNYYGIHKSGEERTLVPKELRVKR